MTTITKPTLLVPPLPSSDSSSNSSDSSAEAAAVADDLSSWIEELLCPPTPTAEAAAIHLDMDIDTDMMIPQIAPSPAAAPPPYASLITSPPLDLQSSKQKRQQKKKAERARMQQAPRVAFQIRSDKDVLDDGYKWRKYGQKAVKNSRHPRNYYRCNVRECLVKKRVERSTVDPTLVVTTYQGVHNHYRKDQESNDWTWSLSFMEKSDSYPQSINSIML